MFRFFVLFLCLCATYSLKATYSIPDCTFKTDWTLEVRGAYFYIPETKVKKVISDSWIDYQVEIAKRVTPHMEFFGGVYWCTKDKTLKKHCGPFDSLLKINSRTSILPIAAGIKGIYPIAKCLDIYAGVGICVSFLKIKNSYSKREVSYAEPSALPYRRNTTKSNLGALLKTGAQYALSQSTFLDFFVDYYMQSFSLSYRDHTIFKDRVDFSGLKVGAGFGVYF